MQQSLFTADAEPTPAVFARPRRGAGRETRDLRRGQSAAEALAGLDHSVELFGFTRGQFSLLDLLLAALQLTGPARLTLSTFSASRAEVDQLAELHQAGQLTGLRLLVDTTFARRERETVAAVRGTFGPESLRAAENHAKFAIIENDTWRLVLRTSMNLNMNARNEDFTIAHDPELADFLAVVFETL